MPPKFYKKKPNNKINENISSNAKYLIIVESPSKCTKIEHFLGIEYCCIASIGHIRTVDGLKSIDTKNTFEPTFSIIEEKKDHVKSMTKIISQFSKCNILVATDDDREGEAIAWHICQVFDLPVETTPRIIFHEITKPAILVAVNNPTIINMNIVKAQHARQVLDIIVGYKISPFLWKYLYHNKSNSLSAGRCQTPALRLVYDNEKEKKNSTDINSLESRYKTTGTFFSKQIIFELNHEFETSTNVLDFMEKSKQFEHQITLGSPKESISSPPKPFHTSRLLQTASNILHMSPKETMSICQKLYQNGYITYMRTESSQYSQTFLEQAKTFITNEWANPDYIGDFDKLENKDTSNPHEAIRVTHIETRFITNASSSENSIDSTRMSSLYRLIWKNTIESCMSESKSKMINIKITAPQKHHYSYTIEIPLFLGWKKVNEKSNDEVDIKTGLLLFFQSIQPNIIKGSKSFIIDSTITVKNKHSHYCEASLIHKLEELGIGRPSTFASIVETIQERGYVKRMDIIGQKIECKEYKLEDNNITEIIKERTFGNEKNKLVIQPVGIITVEFLIEHFNSMFSYEYTKTMEDQLDKVAINNNDTIIWSEICKQCYNEIIKLSKPINNTMKQLYTIDEDHDLVFEKYGPVIRHKLENGLIEFLSVKTDIDIEKLKRNEYKLDEILQIKTENKSIGKYEDKDLFVKDGKFGLYIEWGDRRESIKSINRPIDEITLQDIETFLEGSPKEEKQNLLRTLNEVMSVRKGKFGAYVYYKRPDMKTPKFLNIKGFKEGFFACSTDTLVKWLCETYKLPNP